MAQKSVCLAAPKTPKDVKWRKPRLWPEGGRSGIPESRERG
ncbi:MAG: hypothetical protein ACKVUS_20360 [Saprospiraceae bacterium]